MMAYTSRRKTQANVAWSMAAILVAGAIILTVVPLPEYLRPFRPHWIILALFYLGVFSPMQSGIVRSWLLGVVVDVLTGTLMGMHALTFSLTTFITLRFHLQLRVFVVAQQMITITILILLNLIVEIMIRAATGNLVDTIYFWGPLISTPLFWPPVYILASRLTRLLNER
ncbi:MAG: rod shape-determining protein MreD [Gammaproteobacteria bacterium]|uniref:Rod shape-determining protein MreD n=1 Tax=Candidatus Thiopontia autotrophica TaxID=2841688 RepID=A0A8J6TWZ4_9GAMM|nr:rod shape-determining protein MreD [Candidatus Thiopontia autotrophica]